MALFKFPTWNRKWLFQLDLKNLSRERTNNVRLIQQKSEQNLRKNQKQNQKVKKTFVCKTQLLI